MKYIDYLNYTILLLIALISCNCGPAAECRQEYKENRTLKLNVCTMGCDEEDDAYSCEATTLIYMQGNEGRAFYRGDRVKMDFRKAIVYAKKACKLNTISAFCNWAEAMSCFIDPAACKKSCEKGNGSACYHMAFFHAGSLYREDSSPGLYMSRIRKKMKKSNKKFFAYWKRACELKYQAACPKTTTSSNESGDSH